jgi:hypothetical protein
MSRLLRKSTPLSAWYDTERAQAVELAKKDVEAARGICTVLPPSLQLHFRGRPAAAESALAQQL